MARRFSSSMDVKPRLLAGKARREMGMVWQPIEMAPRDGTNVDLWVVSSVGDFNAWREPDCHWKDGEWVQWDRLYGEWAPVEEPDLQRVTDWMPLPPAPPADK